MRRIIKNVADPNIRRELEAIWERLNFIETKTVEPTTENLPPGGLAVYDSKLYLNDRGTIRNLTPTASDAAYLKADGSVDLEGNLSVDAGVTIDGVDIGAHKAATAKAGHDAGVGDHTHQSSGAEGAKLDHGAALTGLDDNDHGAAYLYKENTNAFTPDGDYEPATKKYVDDNSASPGGSDTQVQFNDGGSFGGDSELVWDKANDRLYVGSEGIGSQVAGLNVVKYTEFDADYAGYYNEIGYNSSSLMFAAKLQILTDGITDVYGLLVQGSVANATQSYMLMISDIGENPANYSLYIFSTSPKATLHNYTQEDGDGGRESIISFEGEQSGGEATTLAAIRAQHDGASDDEKGDLIFYTNDGNDGASPTERLRIDSAGAIILASIKSGATQVAAGAAAGEIWKTASHASLPDNVLMIGV